ncbi:MAG: hypothetical protein OQK73_09110 [Gammaproteobacteria bacterium]|nr:hypothetical protein [Gammaproteobacteria bacterium]
MQQINLYQAVFRKTTLLLSARSLLRASAALAGFLVVVTALLQWQLSQQSSALETAKAQQTAQLAKLAKLQQQVQNRQQDKKLLHEIEVLSTHIANKQRVMQVLTTQRFGNTDGFTEHVKGLARQRIDGMWLTDISISKGGEHLGMKGQALQAELLPRYLQRLSSEAAFLGKSFKTLNIARNDKNPSWVDFNLQSVIPEKAGSMVNRGQAQP